MSESAVGRSVAATRQNGGSAPVPRDSAAISGGSVPSTTRASVTVTCAIASDAIRSQESPSIAAAGQPRAAAGWRSAIAIDPTADMKTADATAARTHIGAPLWNRGRRNRGRRLHVDFALLAELDRHFFHAGCGVVAHLLGQLHGAELRPAHRAEVRHLGALGRQRLVVVRARGHRIEREIELILPPELEPRFRQRVVPFPRAWMPF